MYSDSDLMTLRRGSTGDAVLRLQTRLRELGFYGGPLDGHFGGGSEAAVKSFQKTHGLKPDGEVGARTWQHLLPNAPHPECELLAAPVSERCLGLTGSFETSCTPPDCFCGLTGDFDGQGMSFGALQWNLGQGTLQPMLNAIVEKHQSLAESIFHEHLGELRRMLASRLPDQLAFARSLQDRRHRFFEPWQGMFRSLGRTTEFRRIQTEAARKLFQRSCTLAEEYDLHSQRGTALMFDILTQNGSISAGTRAEILRDYAAIPSSLSSNEVEVERMRIIARRRAAAARQQFRNDVLTRKMTIAEGTGVVHNVRYDLADQFGLTLDPLASAARV